MSAIYTHETLKLAPGEVIERTYWATTHHYGFTEQPDQATAEAAAFARPTNVEVLSYADRHRGVIPAGTGWVELRVLVRRSDGASDFPIARYPILSPRKDPA